MLFRSYRKRKALESYRYLLGARLRGVIGRKETYSVDEVLATARAYKLSESFLCYALAMYCDREAFDAYHREHGEVACNYDRLWRELSEAVSYQRVAEVPADNDRSSDIGEVIDALSHASGGHHAGFEATETGYDAGCDTHGSSFDTSCDTSVDSFGGSYD